eukprot:scaffold14166_cov175-Skeletonema_dohrnii-CCMP3373.AAC.1
MAGAEYIKNMITVRNNDNATVALSSSRLEYHFLDDSFDYVNSVVVRLQLNEVANLRNLVIFQRDHVRYRSSHHNNNIPFGINTLFDHRKSLLIFGDYPACHVPPSSLFPSLLSFAISGSRPKQLVLVTHSFVQPCCLFVRWMYGLWEFLHQGGLIQGEDSDRDCKDSNSVYANIIFVSLSYGEHIIRYIEVMNYCSNTDGHISCNRAEQASIYLGLVSYDRIDAGLSQIYGLRWLITNGARMLIQHDAIRHHGLISSTRNCIKLLLDDAFYGGDYWISAMSTINNRSALTEWGEITPSLLDASTVDVPNMVYFTYSSLQYDALLGIIYGYFVLDVCGESHNIVSIDVRPTLCLGKLLHSDVYRLVQLLAQDTTLDLRLFRHYPMWGDLSWTSTIVRALDYCHALRNKYIAAGNCDVDTTSDFDHWIMSTLTCVKIVPGSINDCVLDSVMRHVLQSLSGLTVAPFGCSEYNSSCSAPIDITSPSTAGAIFKVDIVASSSSSVQVYTPIRAIIVGLSSLQRCLTGVLLVFKKNGEPFFVDMCCFSHHRHVLVAIRSDSLQHDLSSLWAQHRTTYVEWGDLFPNQEHDYCGSHSFASWGVSDDDFFALLFSKHRKPDLCLLVWISIAFFDGTILTFDFLYSNRHDEEIDSNDETSCTWGAIGYLFASILILATLVDDIVSLLTDHAQHFFALWGVKHDKIGHSHSFAVWGVDDDDFFASVVMTTTGLVLIGATLTSDIIDTILFGFSDDVSVIDRPEGPPA